MEWDWSTFVPTLLATFAGVILSVILSLGVYRLWDWINAKRQRAATKHILSLEIASSLGTLKSVRTEASNVIDGKSNIQTWCSPLSTVHTPAYNEAFKRGEIHRLGDRALEEALIKYAEGCEGFNIEMRGLREILQMRWLREIVEKKTGSGVVPIELAQASVQSRLPVLDELINRGYELLRMMDEDMAESDTPSE